jgi:TDG/mug DNA glycosylase family protein
VPEPLEYEDDVRLLGFGIGLTDLVKRPSAGIEDVRREDWLEGRVLLANKLEQFQPKVIAFNGKLAFEKFSGRPCKLGLQKDRLYGARVFVLPSTSGQNVLARGQKLRYFRKLAALVEEAET